VGEWRFLGELTVCAKPVAQSRPRAYVRPNGKAGVHDDGKSRGWKAAIIGQAMRVRLPRGIAAPIRLDVTFELPRPKRLGAGANEPHVNVPDLDNLLKAVMDALSEYGVWKDDRQVAEIRASKWYHAAGGTPLAVVVIDRME
jgi:Holliday junction resolvase RusA-like endonuclease